MTSPVFWMSFAAVFLAIRWIADAVLSGARVEVRRVRRVVDAPPATADQPWPSALDEAA